MSRGEELESFHRAESARVGMQGYISEFERLLGQPADSSGSEGNATYTVPQDRIITDGSDNILDKARDSYFVSVSHAFERLVRSGLILGGSLETLRGLSETLREIIDHSQESKQQIPQLTPEQAELRQRVQTVLKGGKDINDFLNTITDPDEKRELAIRLYKMPQDSLVPSSGEVPDGIRRQREIDIKRVGQLLASAIQILHSEIGEPQ
ncbi:MAG: hypothetical protein M1275_00670 [Patescibacteria group bacterium]|nr:hypothetical protein [Patescibacteria group bacterium]